MLSENGRVESFQPHMHLRGKAMMMEAILPNGQEQVLSYGQRLQLQLDDAATSTPTMRRRCCRRARSSRSTAWHDNTAANKNNPDPNQWVGWGDRTVDEMAHAWVNITYMNDDDFKAELDAPQGEDRAHDAAATAAAVTPAAASPRAVLRFEWTPRRRPGDRAAPF